MVYMMKNNGKKEMAGYVVYNTKTLEIVKSYTYAKSAINLLAKLGAGYTMGDIGIYRDLVAKKADEYITVKSLMTGEPVVIPADTPWCCRPDSEAYWSM
jgi:hypothetical protein